MSAERLVVDEGAAVANLSIGDPGLVAALIEKGVKLLLKFRATDVAGVRQGERSRAAWVGRRTRLLRATAGDKSRGEAEDQSKEDRSGNCVFHLAIDTKP